MTYLYNDSSPTVHIAESGNLSLCGVTRGLNRIDLRRWLKASTWRAINGKSVRGLKRRLCLSCKKKSESIA